MLLIIIYRSFIVFVMVVFCMCLCSFFFSFFSLNSFSGVDHLAMLLDGWIYVKHKPLLLNRCFYPIQTFRARWYFIFSSFLLSLPFSFFFFSFFPSRMYRLSRAYKWIEEKKPHMLRQINMRRVHRKHTTNIWSLKLLGSRK